MTTTVIRKKLQEYIKTADDKKIRAIFTLVESDMEEQYNWWEDEKLVNEFNDRVDKCISGEEKSSSWEDIKSELANKKQVESNEI